MTLRLFVGTAVSVVVVLGGLSYWLVPRLMSQTNTFQPVYLEMAESATNQAVQHSMGKRKYLAVRSDGSRSTGTLQSDFTPAKAEIREIALIPQKKRVLIDDSTSTTSTFYLAAESIKHEVTRNRSPVQNCAPPPAAGEAFLGEAAHLGFRVFRFSTRQNHSEFKAYQGERWYAPDIDCRLVRQFADFTRTNNSQRHFERAAVNVKIGEPDAVLFEVPAGYREVAPSQQLRENHVLQGQNTTKEDENEWARIDKVYWESQRNKPTP